MMLLVKPPLFVLAAAWGIAAIFLVLIPCEVAAAACFLTGQKRGGSACMEAAFSVMYGPIGWVSDLGRGKAKVAS